MNENVALQLAGLQAQVLWGNFDPALCSRYNEVEQYLHTRIISSNKSKTREDWKKGIAEAHKVCGWVSRGHMVGAKVLVHHSLILPPPSQTYGTGKSEIKSKVWYLTSVKHYPLYGSTFFPVHYKGFWSYPNSLILAVDLVGIKFVNLKSKQVGVALSGCGHWAVGHWWV